METGKLSDWLQIGANVGILVGLVFVGIQVRQDHQLAAADLELESYSSLLAFQASAMGEKFADAMAVSATDPSAITTEQLQAMIYYSAGLVGTLRRAALMESLGLKGPDWRETTLPYVAWELGGNPVTRAILFSNDDPDDLAKDWFISLRTQARNIDPSAQGNRFSSIWNDLKN